jgi:UDP-glucuronate 4-epimerase
VRLPVVEYSNYVNRNIVGFSNLLRACVINAIPDFIYASSSSVYGNFEGISSSEITRSPDPISFYGATKLAGEILASSNVRNSQTRARGLRLFTVYGPWGRPDMAYFRLLSSVLTDYPFRMFGDGLIRRDFTNISDITKFTRLLGEELSNYKPGFHDVVNIGGGNPVSLVNMIETLEEILDKKIRIKKFEHNINDVNFTNANTGYLESLVGSKPTIKLKEGLTEVAEWASNLPNINELKIWSESVS